jgi:NADH:ubiquinone reductase (non-electrogenic)
VQDLLRLYPDVYPDVTITIVEGKGILGAFDQSLREYAEKKFKRDRIRVRTGAAVTAVDNGKVTLSNGDEIEFGLGIWNTGLTPNKLIRSLDDTVIRKDNWGHVVVDDHLRVQRPAASGSPGATTNSSTKYLSGVYALGDCASVEDQHYAATAQVAEQQGTYLARCITDAIQAAAVHPDPVQRLHSYAAKEPFVYHHAGTLAFIGSFTAVSDFTKGGPIAPLYGKRLHGWISWFLWRSAYLTQLGFWRNRIQVPADWARTLIFGRDTTTF